MLFRAKIALRSVCDITLQLLEKLGVCGLLLDIDNTLTTHDNPVPAAGVEAWVAGMQAAGISLCLVSNNHPPRVEPFAKRLGLDFVCEGKKPLTKGYREAVQKMGLSRKEVAAVGDQIFTDVLGANLFGVPCIFVSILQQVFHLQNIFFIDRSTVHVPSTFHEVVCFIDQKQIISADIVCKKSFQMCRRIEHIIIITDHPIRPF